ncbi:MAG: GNAT family N-acetyltransferase [Bacilli bacterium]|nr:GNAT family N-acetyltransferase [Bacilli bacterium]
MGLRKLEYKDIPYMLEWMHDDSVTEFMGKDFSKIDEEQAKKFIDNSINDVNVNYAIVDEFDEYMGTVSLKNIDYENKKAEYAICIRSKAMGKGLSKMATNEILRIAFDELNLNKVYLYVSKDNVRANKFYQKYDFILEGEFIEDMYIKGQFKDINWYRILKKEYNERMK